MGAAKDAFDTIDLSDNEIRQLSNFPLMQRLRNLIICNNRISVIDPQVAKALPNLESLVLTNNYFRELEELEPLRYFKNLKRLSLLDNLVTKKPNYRLYVIHLLPKLKVLDFCKVKEKEREEAKQVFGGEKKVKTFEVGKVEQKSTLTDEQIKKIKEAIQNAKSITEIARYEEALKYGKMPKELEDKA